ncbi:hypothetical protein C5E45_18635 [Nocardia nova]|uniref:HTH hxlR-type domain-containing protein n=2 Tax=Nocardia nova TaxID=37330 RepID=A0A2S6ANX2_9NOCA|nr:hypothetical protein C5E41_20410 [Nocardia nova]PPJ36886.1 hypothetical protein C5E45_18635 [Nocardia nova]
MLVRQLRELEADGLVTRTVFDTVPPQGEYDPTAEGRGLVPVPTALYGRRKAV